MPQNIILPQDFHISKDRPMLISCSMNDILFLKILKQVLQNYMKSVINNSCDNLLSLSQQITQTSLLKGMKFLQIFLKILKKCFIDTGSTITQQNLIVIQLIFFKMFSYYDE